MSENGAHGLSRRDLLKLGAAVGGATILPAATASLTAPWLPMPDSPGSPVAGPPKGIVDNLPEKISASRAKRPNVLLIVLDTVRADHLSCYGYERETTPNLRAFAAGARQYTNAMSPSCHTLPSHASLFTGLPEAAHGAGLAHQYLDRQSVTLAELLTKAGYQTAAWSCNLSYVGPRCGLNRGFRHFRNCAFAPNVHQELGRWFTGEYPPEKPFFIFLNYIEAHFPYWTPPDHVRQWVAEESRESWQKNSQTTSWRMFEHMLTGLSFCPPEEMSLAESLYDEAIAYLDIKLSQLFAFLGRSGLEENTLVVVTSDHGEHFNEHHMTGHGYSMYEPNLRVPLIVRYADRFPAGRDNRLVQGHDVFPTILEIAGVPWDRKPAHSCQSLLGPEDPARLGTAGVLSTNCAGVGLCADKYPQLCFSRFINPVLSARRGNMKLIVSPTEGLELYDLEKDPLELTNLASQRPQIAQNLSQDFQRWQKSFDGYRYATDAHTNLRAQTTEEEFRAARGLGYIH